MATVRRPVTSTWVGTPEHAATVRREIAIFNRDVEAANHGSAPEKRADAARMLRDLAEDPVLMYERAGWLTTGQFGQGAVYAAQQAYVHATTRKAMRRWLFISTAALDWSVPMRYAVTVYKRLPNQLAVDRQLDKVIDEMKCIDHEEHVTRAFPPGPKREAALALLDAATDGRRPESAGARQVLADALEEVGDLGQATALREVARLAGDREGVYVDDELRKRCLLAQRHAARTRRAGGGRW